MCTQCTLIFLLLFILEVERQKSHMYCNILGLLDCLSLIVKVIEYFRERYFAGGNFRDFANFNRSQRNRTFEVL